MNIALPQRQGDRPSTSKPSREHAFPHQQLDQIAPASVQDALVDRARQLIGVRLGRSYVSLPDARAFHLDDDRAQGPAGAFQRRTEFAHVHGLSDGSLHLTLPSDVFDEVLATGWGEPHPVSGTMMVFGPRDDEELEIVWRIVQTSYQYATGELDGVAP